MSAPRHDLGRILALAQEMARPDISAQGLAASCGPVTDPVGRGEQLDVEPPGITGVHSMTVIPERGTGASGSPRVVMFAFAVGNRPRLSEVASVFGAGEAVKPLDWEPQQRVFDGASSDHASVKVLVTTDDGEDPSVRELSLRRDRRTPVTFDVHRIFKFASAVGQSNATPRSLAAAFGHATTPGGSAWTVKQPDVAGVSNVLAMGPPDVPLMVLFSFKKGNRPRLSEVEAGFGQGQVVAPEDWEPWRVVYKGPTTASKAVKIVLSTDAVTGEEQDPLVTEIAVRRLSPG